MTVRLRPQNEVLLNVNNFKNLSAGYEFVTYNEQN